MSTVQHTLPPPCPDCKGEMTLKEVHKNTRGGYTCFFRCVACYLHYPHIVPADSQYLAAVFAPPSKSV